jgi:hypothetical protein
LLQSKKFQDVQERRQSSEAFTGRHNHIQCPVSGIPGIHEYPISRKSSTESLSFIAATTVFNMSIQYPGNQAPILYYLAATTAFDLHTVGKSVENTK